jgi:nitrogen-specific signal transduction histidine kinase
MLTKTNSLIHLISTPVIITDVAFRFVDANEAAQNLLALSEQTLQGSILNFIDSIEEDLLKLINNKNQSLENIRLLNVSNLLIDKSWTLKASRYELNQDEEGYCFVLEENFLKNFLKEIQNQKLQ